VVFFRHCSIVGEGSYSCFVHSSASSRLFGNPSSGIQTIAFPPINIAFPFYFPSHVVFATGTASVLSLSRPFCCCRGVESSHWMLCVSEVICYVTRLSSRELCHQSTVADKLVSSASVLVRPNVYHCQFRYRLGSDTCCKAYC
jgi:hypothetical protein